MLRLDMRKTLLVQRPEVYRALLIDKIDRLMGMTTTSFGAVNGKMRRPRIWLQMKCHLQTLNVPTVFGSTDSER